MEGQEGDNFTYWLWSISTCMLHAHMCVSYYHVNLKKHITYALCTQLSCITIIMKKSFKGSRGLMVKPLPSDKDWCYNILNSELPKSWTQPHLRVYHILHLHFSRNWYPHPQNMYMTFAYTSASTDLWNPVSKTALQ